MKTLQTYRRAPFLFLALMLLFTACDSLTGVDLNESSALERTVLFDEEPPVREIPEHAATRDQVPLPFSIEQAAPDLPDKMVEFGAVSVTHNFHSVTVRFAARSADSNLYYVMRQIKGYPPVLVRFFNGLSLPTVTETLTKDVADRWVEYWIQDDGGLEVSPRIRFDMPPQGHP